jgi:hypothetical protein
MNIGDPPILLDLVKIKDLYYLLSLKMKHQNTKTRYNEITNEKE